MGDNFERVNGDASHFNSLLYHTHGAYEKGQDLHMESMPTQAEKVHRDFVEKKEALLTERQKEVFEKYGGACPTVTRAWRAGVFFARALLCCLRGGVGGQWISRGVGCWDVQGKST